MAVTVKKLEWTEREGSQGQNCWDAEGVWIVKYKDSYLLCDSMIPDDLPCSPFMSAHETLDEAKAEAQALSAIEEPK